MTKVDLRLAGGEVLLPGLGIRSVDVLVADDRDSLLLWGTDGPALPLDPVGLAVQLLFPKAGPLEPIEGGSHFLQEDRGEVTGRRIAEWLAG